MPAKEAINRGHDPLLLRLANLNLTALLMERRYSASS